MVTQCFKERMFPSEIYLVETFLHNNIESKDSSFAQSYRWSESVSDHEHKRNILIVSNFVFASVSIFSEFCKNWLDATK